MAEPSTRLHLRVSPGASAAGIVGRHGAAWKVRVAAPAERGRANRALVELLAETLAVPRARVEVVSGHGARDKVVAVAGLTDAEAARRLAGAMADGE